MAFTKITTTIKSNFNKGTGARPNAYFHPEDIKIILEQKGAIAVTQVNAIIDGQDCAVLVGVSVLGGGPPTVATILLDSVGDLIVLPCPPLNHAGGVRLSFP